MYTNCVNEFGIFDPHPSFFESHLLLFHKEKVNPVVTRKETDVEKKSVKHQSV